MTRAQHDELYHSGYTALGSIDGMLDAVNLHQAPFITVWDRLTGVPVRCHIPADWKERARALLGRRVLVTGTIRYFRNGVPQLVAGVTGIRDMTPDPSAPRGDFGSVKGIIGQEDSVQFIRGRRE